MRVSFSSPKKDQPTKDGGVEVPYVAGRRAVSKWRWYGLVLVISTPLLFLIWKVFLSVFLISAPGVVYMDKINVNAPFPAIVRSVMKKPGDLVAEGELLFTLSNSQIDQREEALWMELRLDKDDVEEPELKPVQASTTDPMYLSALGRIRLHRETLRYHEGFRDTVLSLFKAGAATRAELDLAEDRVRQAQALLAESRGAAAALKPAPAERQSASKPEDRSAKIEAELQLLKERREGLSLHSGGDGRVLEVLTSEGESVANGTPLLVIARSERMMVRAYLDPRYLAYALPGSDVAIRFPDGTIVPGVVRTRPELAVRVPQELAGVLAIGRRTLLVTVEPNAPLEELFRVEGLPLTVRFPFSLEKSLASFSLSN